MFTIKEIAEALDRPVEGDPSIRLLRVSEPGAAGPDDLALAMSKSYGPALEAGSARAAILWEGADWRGFGLEAAILVPRARLAMASVTRALDRGPSIAPGVHLAAVVDPSASLPDDAAIGPLAVIEAGVRLGRRCRIGPGVVIGQGAAIGDDAVIHARAVIGARVEIGDRFTCQPGAVIGGDGFSFVTPEESGVEKARRTLGDTGEAVEQSWTRIHSLGSVRIGDDVEVGANATIDRGTVADTTIGRGTKIDNLVHVGHNCRIGEDCLLCGQVGLAGGITMGDRVVLGGQVGVSDNITIGDDVVAGGATVILSRVAAGEAILGYPATKMDTNMAMYRALRRLPRLAEQVAEMRRSLSGGKGAKGGDE
jgi:UDP-3-O-[3-hydroxymyristoyl] glucosamine N-acyltransferase